MKESNFNDLDLDDIDLEEAVLLVQKKQDKKISEEIPSCDETCESCVL